MNTLSLDAAGVFGEILHYTIVIFFVATAFIIFLYLWYKGRLDMDESPKIEMMQTDDIRENDHGR